ncbi:MAG: bifunctional folylpolyglutamate synthase/dihydrofolate synthase [Crocinitomix sp.]|nr:bifunctional folylpolyglutamate synthase/dihydrofolate synthase [Crocinitomix sp.]
MRYQEIVDWLFQQIPNYQRQGGSAYKPGLDGIHNLLEKTGNPFRELKTIHVAGTNGKGSVSHILSTIFQAHGYQVGLFTSPHITDFRERIKINGELIETDFVEAYFNQNKTIIEKLDASFFEITTALAFAAFSHKNCDICIIETGLGGRLDSTNVIKPELSIITNIAMDHVSFLGDTLEKIAAEKAGIIKEHVPVVIGDCDPALYPVFKHVAYTKSSPIVFAHTVTIPTYATDLLGSFQQRNIHTAVAGAELLREKWLLNEKTTLESLKNVIGRSNFKGRMQQISDQPRVILDAAHNQEGIEGLLREVQTLDFEHLRIVYGASNDKEWQTILAHFSNKHSYYFTTFASKRAVSIADFKSELKDSDLTYELFNSPFEALNKCKSDAQTKDLILVCGSFYLMEKII